MEPVLTQEELEAIYAAMRSGEGSGAAIAECDLTAGQAYISAAESRWTSMGKAMSSKLEVILTGALGRRTRIKVLEAIALDKSQAPPAEASAEEAAALDLGEPTSAIRALRVGKSRMLMGFDKSIAFKFVDRRTGGADDEMPAEIPDRDLTLLEQTLIDQLFSDLCDTLAGASPLARSVKVDQANPLEVWRERDHQQVWILLRFAVSRLGGAGVWLRGPAGVLLPRPAKLKETLARKLTSAQVTVSVELGRFNLNVSELWRLAPGQEFLLPVAKGDLVRVMVGDVNTHKGFPIVHRSSMAVEIKERIGSGAKT
jgi:flagellar motor switch protein FliM